eukprot:scpid103169/ scgid27309/ 
MNICRTINFPCQRPYAPPLVVVVVVSPHLLYSLYVPVLPCVYPTSFVLLWTRYLWAPSLQYRISMNGSICTGYNQSYLTTQNSCLLSLSCHVHGKPYPVCFFTFKTASDEVT